jgi:hypothetical protein
MGTRQVNGGWLTAAVIVLALALLGGWGAVNMVTARRTADSALCGGQAMGPADKCEEYRLGSGGGEYDRRTSTAEQEGKSNITAEHVLGWVLMTGCVLVALFGFLCLSAAFQRRPVRA